MHNIAITYGLSAGIENPVVHIYSIFTLKGPSLSLNAHLKFIFKTNNNSITLLTVIFSKYTFSYFTL